MSSITVVSRTQHIVVNPSTYSVSVFYAGPVGPPGASMVSDWMYGTGADGVVNFDGISTVLGLVPVAGKYKMNRDIFLDDGSQVSGTAILDNANFRIHCRGTFTIGPDASINADGKNATGTTGGIGGNLGSLTPSDVNGTSGVLGGNAGFVTGNGNPSIGGSSGASGASTGSGGIGGGVSAENTTTIPVTANPNPRTMLAFLSSRWSSGAAAPGGKAAASSTGGGGGSAGRVIMIIAYQLVLHGMLSCKGGNGGAASGAGTGAGGGAGAGGGVILLAYHIKSGINSILVAGALCEGGSGGAPQGAGNYGASGATGSIIELVV